MTWPAQIYQLPQLFEEHISFDVALGVVIFMLVLSVITHIARLPKRMVKNNDIQAAMKELEDAHDTAQIDKLWQYGLHEDDMFNERQNFFLLFESILLGGAFTVFAISSQSPSDKLQLVLQIAAFIGLFTTVAWWYIQMRQEYILDCITLYYKRLTPAYGKLLYPIRRRPYRISSAIVLVYGFPIVVAILWAVVLLYT